MDYDKSDIATVYDEARALTPERVRQWRDVLSLDLAPAAITTVADLGCGTGRFTELLASHFTAQVIGIDPSRRMIEQARRKSIAENIVFRQARAEALPLQDGSVDLAFMSQAYHHLSDPSAVARECFRILRQSGQMCIRNTTRDCDFPYRHFFLVQPLIDSDLPTREEIRSVFLAVGFAVAADRMLSRVVATDWPSFARNSALRADSFLARLSDPEFESGMAALRAHAAAVDRDCFVSEEISWFIFTKQG
jgi:ubiquinone/menaquinone biosynthesis C-methylase UbiE